MAAESEECIALGLETLNEVCAQWGVCVEESTTIKVGSLLSPQDPQTWLGLASWTVSFTEEPGPWHQVLRSGQQ